MRSVIVVCVCAGVGTVVLLAKDRWPSRRSRLQSHGHSRLVAARRHLLALFGVVTIVQSQLGRAPSAAPLGTRRWVMMNYRAFHNAEHGAESRARRQ